MKYYDTTYWDSFTKPYQMEDRLSRRMVVKKLKLLGVKSVLDVGCGSGPFYSLCKGMKYKGVDYSKTLIGFAKELDDCFEVQDARDLKEKDNSWDAVLLYHALDHIGDWKKALEEAYRVVRDYAVVVLWKPFVPGKKTVTNRGKFYFDSKYKDTWMHEFSKVELANVIDRVGFIILEAKELKAEGYNFMYLLAKI